MKSNENIKDEIVTLSKDLQGAQGAQAVYIKAKIEALNWVLEK